VKLVYSLWQLVMLFDSHFSGMVSNTDVQASLLINVQNKNDKRVIIKAISKA